MNQSFLSLGDMLTFIALIVAVLQLIKPRYLLVWKLSNNFLKSIAIFLLVTGYLAPFVSIIVANKRDIWDDLSLRQLIQTLGFVAITLGLLIIIYIYSPLNYRHLITNVTKVKFQFNKYPKKKWRFMNLQIERRKTITTRSAKKFYFTTSQFLVGGYIREVVRITGLNIKPLVHAARQYTPEAFRFPESQERELPKPIGPNFAFETLYLLLTDEAVMKHICTNDRFFLGSIVESELNDYDNGSTRNDFADILYSNIISHLVLNANSFIYTQKDYHSGTARLGNVYDLLTDDRIIKRQRIIPSLLTWEVSKTDIALDEYTGVLLELLKRMIDSYKKTPGSSELLGNIRQIFDQLIGDSGVTRNIAFDKKARQHYADDVVRSMPFKVFSKLHLAFSSDLSFKSDDPQSFVSNNDELKSENKRGAYEQTTLTGLLAFEVYELLEDLSVFYQDSVDPDASLMREVFSYMSIHVNTPVAIRYKELLWERLFDKAVDGKLEKYRTNIEGNYPIVLRFIINYLTPFREGRDKADDIAQTRLKSIMAGELAEALLANKKMNGDELMKDALLPSKVKVVINKTKKSVKYQFIDSKGKKTYLDLTNTPKKPKKS